MFERFLNRSKSAQGPQSPETTVAPDDSHSKPGSRTSGVRVEGRPTSSNKASSLHARWEIAHGSERGDRLVEASAVVEVLQGPAIPKLHFWALQVDFFADDRRLGAGHFGLQYHPDYPSNGAVNWGGYAHSGGQLEGSVSDLPSARNNINSRNYAWQTNSTYRYRIYPSPDQGWRGSITNLETGAETVVRDLSVAADSIGRPMVWTESFAHCDHPGVSVRWSEMQARTQGGRLVEVAAVKLNYQSYEAGGCSNSNTSASHGQAAIIQATNSERTNPTGTRLSIPG